MKMSKVGNQTNSQDPQAVNSRVFVGNLNTFQCSKTDVERMFQRYGRLAGISMHKGYAFVQFTNPFDARSACLGEDGRTVLSQVLDVNMVAEPKPHQTGRKRQNMSKTGNDWDYYYDSYYASTTFPVGPPRLVPPLKRPRLMTTTTGQQRTKATTQKITTALPANTTIDQLKIYSNPDILICGNCREMFTDLQDLLEHKKTYCKLRFTCKCHTLNGINDNSKPPGEGDDQSIASLLCVQCKDSFQSAWDLMVHAQAAHMLNIYTLGVPQSGAGNVTTDKPESPDHEQSPCRSPALSPVSRNNSPDKEATKNGNGTMVTPEPHETEFEMENGRSGLGSPDSENSNKEIEELMELNHGSGAPACIVHALSVVSAPASQPGGSPPPLAATAPLTIAESEWKATHTRLSPNVRPY